MREAIALAAGRRLRECRQARTTRCSVIRRRTACRQLDLMTVGRNLALPVETLGIFILSLCLSFVLFG